ncbi:YbaB/EbfC family nucleoid-associated protein [Amycolatopsis anabasis]|uniref:YbaB/EbfC family nucleoid-associated protein n=1 Tax=Amycolatopsis anabasis TaxID=1840409 RepID=UPI00131AB942|nr:YbaB/EbfC family nucleoid-associated protein [Amycolatopsis anabasis]
MSAEFEQLVAQFEKFQAKLANVDDRLEHLGGMQEELTGLEATATSADRSITVVAGPGGSIKDIQFTEDALKQRPQALSAALLTTLREAVAESARRQAGIVEDHMGGDLSLVDQVLETQAELLGTTVDELRSKVAEEHPKPAEQPDDFSQRSVLRAEPETPRPAAPAAGDSAGDRFLKNLFDEEDH